MASIKVRWFEDNRDTDMDMIMTEIQENRPCGMEEILVVALCDGVTEMKLNNQEIQQGGSQTIALLSSSNASSETGSRLEGQPEKTKKKQGREETKDSVAGQEVHKVCLSIMG